MPTRPRPVVCHLLLLVGLLFVPGCFFVVGDTICGSELDLPCGRGSYCQYDEGSCGDGGAVGVCAAFPEACTDIYQPVCGCDGETYSSSCVAAEAGVNVASAGECVVDGG